MFISSFTAVKEGNDSFRAAAESAERTGVHVTNVSSLIEHGAATHDGQVSGRRCRASRRAARLYSRLTPRSIIVTCLQPGHNLPHHSGHGPGLTTLPQMTPRVPLLLGHTLSGYTQRPADQPSDLPFASDFMTLATGMTAPGAAHRLHRTAGLPEGRRPCAGRQPLAAGAGRPAGLPRHRRPEPRGAARDPRPVAVTQCQTSLLSTAAQSYLEAYENLPVARAVASKVSNGAASARLRKLTYLEQTSACGCRAGCGGWSPRTSRKPAHGWCALPFGRC